MSKGKPTRKTMLEAMLAFFSKFLNNYAQKFHGAREQWKVPLLMNIITSLVKHFVKG